MVRMRVGEDGWEDMGLDSCGRELGAQAKLIQTLQIEN